MKTVIAKKETVKRNWRLYDLKGQVLGRAATDIARMLMGKDKSLYTPHVDTGDYVVAINAGEIKVTGNKMSDKMYYRHSNYPGGFRAESMGEKMNKDPKTVIEAAVKGMLPKNRLQTPRLRRLKVFSGTEHPYAQHLEGKKSNEKGEVNAR